MFKKLNLDSCRLIAAFLIITIHTSIFSSISTEFDFFFTRILSRIAVPLFLMITGYFIVPKALKDRRTLIDYSIKIAKMYFFAILVYIPLNIYQGSFSSLSFIELLKSIFIDGTVYHLWYFPALLFGIWLVYFLLKKVNIKIVIFLVLMLFFIGLLGDSYYQLVESNPFLFPIYEFIFSVSSYTRNGLFYVPVFLVLGYVLRSRKISLKKSVALGLLIFSFLLLTVEGFVLHYLNFQRHDSMYMMLLPVMFYLFYLIKEVKTTSRYKRNIATTIYIFHPWFIIVVRGVAKLLNLQKFMIDNSVIHYILVAGTTLIFAISLEKVKEVMLDGRRKRTFVKE